MGVASVGIHIEHELRRALTEGQFQLYYQPKVSLTSGQIEGIEALIRWQHPVRGVISPAQFIPVAEETGLIIPIGDWVLLTACKQNREWQEAGFSSCVVSVNLSVRQLFQPDFTTKVSHILTETGLAPKYLELEITESLMMNLDQAEHVLGKLRSLGVQISLDDFGTGYSSLSYLKGLPLNTLKIDQSFVKNCTVDMNDAALVKAIIAIAHQLGLEVIAEGVERRDHLVFLQQNLCNQAQGYLFSKPLPPQELVQYFADIEQIVGRDGIPQDLSRQTFMEQAVQEARRELAETIRLQQGMIFKFIEKDGKFVHTLCDGELVYRMGYSPEQVVGRELQDFLPNGDATEKLEYYRRAWDHNVSVSYEGHINGVYYIASLRPVVRGGQVVEVIGSSVDISDLKKAEEALKLSERTYRLIADGAQDLIGVVDVTGKLQYVSPSYENVLGFPPEVFEGEGVLRLIHPEDVSMVRDKYVKMLLSKAPCQVEFRYKDANGQWVYIEAKCTPVLNNNGEIERVVIIGQSRDECTCVTAL